MENSFAPTNSQLFLLNQTPVIKKTYYRGFVSIDQEMGRDIAMNFFNSQKKSVCSQKGFVFVKK